MILNRQDGRAFKVTMSFLFSLLPICASYSQEGIPVSSPTDTFCVESDSYYEGGAVIPHGEVSHLVAALKSETLEQSFKGLLMTQDYTMNLDPGGESLVDESGMKYVLHEDKKKIALILRNRRFLKVYQELVPLDRESQSEMITRHFRVFFDSYERLLEAEANKHVLPAGSALPQNPSIVVLFSGTPTSPDILGTQLALLATVLLAGEFRVSGLFTELVPMLNEVESARTRFMDAHKNVPTAALHLLWRRYGINNVLLLSNAVLKIGQTADLEGRVSASALKDLADSVQLDKYIFCPWNARVSSFDMVHRLHGLPDYESKGTYTIELPSTYNDSSEAAVSRIAEDLGARH